METLRRIDGKIVIHLYALISVSIGMACHPIEEWETRAILKEEAMWNKTGATIRVVIPERIREFYKMDVGMLDATGCQKGTWS